MQDRQRRRRSQVARRAAIAWRRAAREREAILLAQSQDRELTPEELFEVLGADTSKWRPFTLADGEAMRLQPGDLQPWQPGAE